MIKSYKSLIADGGIDTIPLHTNDGKTGYRVKKFELLAHKPGNEHNESVVKIFTIPQTTTDAFIDFTDNTLLAAGYYRDDASRIYSQSETVIFDNAIINQDIYITHVDVEAGQSVNYYIELEQVDLTEDQALVAIVKNLRNEQ